LALAVKRLREEHHARGKDVLFEALSPFLDGADAGEYETVAHGEVTSAVRGLV